MMSFINCTKYPPSLLYLLMTLGPAILSLPLLEKMSERLAYPIDIFGKVPFFFYIVHIYLLHAMAVVCFYFFRHEIRLHIFAYPRYPIIFLYLFWVVSILIMYLPCRWFMNVKMRSKKWWLSYL